MNKLEKKLAETGYRCLVGVAIQRYDPPFVEVAALLGFDAIWVEMEHEAISLDQAGDLCRIGSGMGLLTMIRVPNPGREAVLKSAELGPDILDLPMANAPETAAEFVRNARYAPLGTRGFFGSSRAMQYGVTASPRDQQLKINEDLCLLVQVETKEAVDCSADLAAVDGITGLFLGPGDLSSSLGLTGQTDHPLVRDSMLRTIAAAKGKGKIAAAACAPAEVPFWAEQGMNLLFCASNLSCEIAGARAVLADIGDARQRR